MRKYEYDVALSFAGEGRALVREIVSSLRDLDVRVFYDEENEATIWGRNLVDLLGTVYSDQAQYCLMFVSRHYVTKPIPGVEREHAQARALQETGEYILPIRIDDTPVPGMPETIAYIDARERTAQEIAHLVAEKLGRAVSEGVQRPATDYDIPLPRRSGQPTDRERDQFLASSFEDIAIYFQRGCEALTRSGNDVVADFERIDTRTLRVKAYVAGKVVAAANIWRGAFVGSEDSICYGPGDDGVGGRNSVNDWLSVELVDGELALKSNGMDVFGGERDRSMTAREAGEAFWRRFCRPLESQR